MKHQNQKNEGREWYVLDPHRRKKRVSENAEPLTEKREHNLRRRVFFAEMIKGNATARWALLTTDYDWTQPCKKQWSDNLN